MYLTDNVYRSSLREQIGINLKNDLDFSKLHNKKDEYGNWHFEGKAKIMILVVKMNLFFLLIH